MRYFLVLNNEISKTETKFVGTHQLLKITARHKAPDNRRKIRIGWICYLASRLSYHPPLFSTIPFHGDASFASRRHICEDGQRWKRLLVREVNLIEKGDRLLYRSAGKSPCAFRTITSLFFRDAVFWTDLVVKPRGTSSRIPRLQSPSAKTRDMLSTSIIFHSFL